MQGHIAQVITLTTYGNAFFKHASYFNKDFYLSNSTCTFCESVKYVDVCLDGERREEAPYAPDPVTWFERMRTEGVTSLRLMRGPSGERAISDRMTVGFVGGGGRWLIEASGRSSSDWWEGRWQVGDRNRDDRKIWRVTYGRLARGQPPSIEEMEGLGQLRGELESCLREIADFARSQHLDEFAKAFESALSRLNSESPYNDLFHQDIAPLQLLPLAAHQLLGAVQSSWVFGGMGSWNDVGFEGGIQRRYEKVSERLYQLLNRAVVAATNSSIPVESSKRRSWRFWN